MASIGVRAQCLGKLLCTHLYRQFLRPKMEYGLAITIFTKKEYQGLKVTQNSCLFKIYGTKTDHSVTVIHHISKLEYMKDGVITLQARFISRT